MERCDQGTSARTLLVSIKKISRQNVLDVKVDRTMLKLNRHLLLGIKECFLRQGKMRNEPNVADEDPDVQSTIKKNQNELM